MLIRSKSSFGGLKSEVSTILRSKSVSCKIHLKQLNISNAFPNIDILRVNSPTYQSVFLYKCILKDFILFYTIDYNMMNRIFIDKEISCGSHFFKFQKLLRSH